MDNNGTKPIKNFVLVTIDGNIASGKTELIKSIQKNKYITEKYDIIPLYEIISKYLSDLYNNLDEEKKDENSGESFAFKVENDIRNLRLEQFIHKIAELSLSEKDNKKTMIIIDRSIWGNLSFAYKNFADKLLSMSEFLYLNMKLHSDFGKICNLYKPDIMFYLDVKPETCLYRNNLRTEKNEENTENESNLKLDYFTGLDKHHKEVLHNLYFKLNKDNYILNGNQSANKVVDECIKILLERFLQ